MADIIYDPEPVDPAEDPELSPYGEQNDPPVLDEAPEDVPLDEDPYILSDPEDPTSLRVLPEDQFVETDGGLLVLEEDLNAEVENTLPEPVDDENLYPNGLPYDDEGNLMPGWTTDENGDPVYVGGDFVEPATLELAAGARESAARSLAQQQSTLSSQRKQANDGDWRVRLRLAPGANYLYKAASPGILQPLAITDGVVFPYTPQINTNYNANYSTYDLTHSNYRGYFYQNSYVGEISIQATFTAQDTYEANYLLAVIHFFRSVTKMFYGQDAERGAPPPLVYLQGLGQYQFNLAPCVVSQFNYNLPADVDYIRAGSTNINGTDLIFRRDRQNLPTNPFSAAWERLKAAGLPKGGLFDPPAPSTLGTNRPTYVPTKIDLSLTLLPIQSREQVSKQFSLKQFANGDLLKGGFW